jgi:hypothetical protein
MAGGWLLRFALKLILGNKSLMMKMFFLLAEKIVEETDNELDDEFVELLKQALGEEHSDTDELKELV